MQCCNNFFGQDFDLAVADLPIVYMRATPPCAYTTFLHKFFNWPSGFLPLFKSLIYYPYIGKHDKSTHVHK